MADTSRRTQETDNLEIPDIVVKERTHKSRSGLFTVSPLESSQGDKRLHNAVDYPREGIQGSYEDIEECQGCEHNGGIQLVAQDDEQPKSEQGHQYWSAGPQEDTQSIQILHDRQPIKLAISSSEHLSVPTALQPRVHLIFCPALYSFLTETPVQKPETRLDAVSAFQPHTTCISVT